MDQNQPNEVKEHHTWELFQARAMKPNPIIERVPHVYASPPPTVQHQTQCGIEVPVPSQINWRD